MKAYFKRCLSVLLVLIMMSQLITGCSLGNESNNTSGNLVKEKVIQEEQVGEAIIGEESLEEKYIIENLIYEEGIYEYQINENIISQAYVIEVVVNSDTEKEILTQLPEEMDDYDIDWAKVVGKFAVGTSIMLVVGIVNHFSAGSTYFVFGSPVTVAKDAFVGGAIGIALNEVLGCAKDGKVVQRATKKYAIEGFAEGYMWGAISSVLKINSENVKRLKKFKLATGGTAKIKVDGSVFDDAGKLIGKAYYHKNGTWYLLDDSSHVVQIFDSAGKEIIDATVSAGLKNLPTNAKLRIGNVANSVICYTDDLGKVMRMGDDLLPNISYTLKGYTYYTDDCGRISKVVFDKLQLKPEGRIRFDIADSKSIIGKGFERASDDRGHLLADMFDGDNTLANIIPMDGTVNKGEVKAIETTWKKCLQSGGHVKGSIEMQYTGTSFRPDKFNYSYDMGDGLLSTVIPNG